jgi:two-component system chemotaxis response regulator CheB
MTVFRGAGRPMEKLNDIGAPSTFACPDCNSVLWQLHGAGPPRYRCHTGHAFTLRSLEETQAVAAEEALWRAIRALEQREGLLRKLAEYPNTAARPAPKPTPCAARSRRRRPHSRFPGCAGWS